MLTSRENPSVRRVRHLLASAKARREEGLFVIEGARLCADAARSGVPIVQALATAQAVGNYPAACAAVRAVCGEWLDIAPSLAQQLADTQSPQGLFCVCGCPANCRTLDAALPLPTGARVLALENLQDPANLGAVIRTAEALGIDGLVLSGGCDVYNPKVLRGSMGGVFRLPLYLLEGPLDRAVAAWQDQGFTCWACVPQTDAVAVTEAALTQGAVCLIGNEGNGLTAETVAACGGRLTIPMAGRAESLNAAVAASIVMWEMMRR